jgi:Na+(H+)/acetate symporter ActP
MLATLRSGSRVALVAAAVCAAASAYCWVLFFTLYWPHRERFNEAGVYFDEAVGVVHREQTGLLAIPAVALSMLAILSARAWWVRRRRS